MSSYDVTCLGNGGDQCLMDIEQTLTEMNLVMLNICLSSVLSNVYWIMMLTGADHWLIN